MVQNLKQMQLSKHRWASSLHTQTHTHTLSSLPCALTNQANNPGFHNRTKRGDGGRDGTGWGCLGWGSKVCVKCVLYFSVISGYFKGSYWRAAASCTWWRRGCQINVHTCVHIYHLYISLCTNIYGQTLGTYVHNSPLDKADDSDDEQN